MAFDVKQAIIDRLRATKRKKIETVIDYMINNGFFVSQCHTHHRYPGGLADHAWQTYQVALRLYAEDCTNNPSTPILDEDSIAIVTLLHDYYRCSGFRYVQHKDHGMRSARILKLIGFKLPIEEFLAIRFHMRSHSSRNHELYGDALKNPLAQLVYRSDRKSASFKNKHEDFEAQQGYISWNEV